MISTAGGWRRCHASLLTDTGPLGGGGGGGGGQSERHQSESTFGPRRSHLSAFGSRGRAEKDSLTAADAGGRSDRAHHSQDWVKLGVPGWEVGWGPGPAGWGDLLYRLALAEVTGSQYALWTQQRGPLVTMVTELGQLRDFRGVVKATEKWSF